MCKHKNSLNLFFYTVLEAEYYSFCWCDAACQISICILFTSLREGTLPICRIMAKEGRKAILGCISGPATRSDQSSGEQQYPASSQQTYAELTHQGVSRLFLYSSFPDPVESRHPSRRRRLLRRMHNNNNARAGGVRFERKYCSEGVGPYHEIPRTPFVLCYVNWQLLLCSLVMIDSCEGCLWCFCSVPEIKIIVGVLLAGETAFLAHIFVIV